jgi:hypothetical protein
MYGFVTTADGDDLSERLIRLGLARDVQGLRNVEGIGPKTFERVPFLRI